MQLLRAVRVPQRLRAASRRLHARPPHQLRTLPDPPFAATDRLGPLAPLTCARSGKEGTSSQLPSQQQPLRARGTPTTPWQSSRSPAQPRDTSRSPAQPRDTSPPAWAPATRCSIRCCSGLAPASSSARGPPRAAHATSASRKADHKPQRRRGAMAAAAPAPHGKQQHQELAGATDPAATVLELLLQHAPPDQGWVCALLRSSKAVAAAATERLAGTLRMTAQLLSAAEAAGLCFWLSRTDNCRLLCELDIELSLPADANVASADSNSSRRVTHDGVGASLANELKAASAAGALDGLRAFTYRTPDAAPDLLLFALPASAALTRLDVALGPITSDTGLGVDPEWAAVDALYANTPRLTGLRELSLHVSSRFCRYEYEDAASFTPALKPLSALTALTLLGPALGGENGVQPDTIGSLPLSLARFEAELRCMGCMDMRRLTCVTQLVLHSASLDRGDKLPASIVRLSCQELQDVQVLRPLTALEALGTAVHASTAADLAKLAASSSLARLTHLSLDVACDAQAGGDGGVAASLTPLAQLAGAVRELRLTHSSYTYKASVYGPGVAAAAAAAAPQLTHLQLSSMRLDAAALAALPDALSGLRELRELALHGVLAPELAADDAAAARACLAGVAAGCRQLRALELTSWPLDGEGGLVFALAGCSQLTRLQLSACGVGSAALPLAQLAEALAPLRQLRALTLSRHRGVAGLREMRAAFRESSLLQLSHGGLDRWLDR